jgi:hypothetical protein
VYREAVEQEDEAQTNRIMAKIVRSSQLIQCLTRVNGLLFRNGFRAVGSPEIGWFSHQVDV